MLESSLAAAKKERDVTIAFKDAHLALFPPVHQLPTEVLTEIFHLTFEKPYDVFASSRSGPWLLGKVCSRWRQVAWSCTSLWTGFIITDTRGAGPTRFHKVGTKVLLEGALSRSAKRNKFQISMRSLRKTEVSFLVKSAERWHDASFEGSLKDFEPFLKIGKMPSLVALELDVELSFGPLVKEYYQILSSLGKHVPQLRRLTLADVDYFSATGEGCKFPWRQLTELVVRLDLVVPCQEILAYCSKLKTLRDYPMSHYNRVESATSNVPGLQAIVSHPTLSFIDMSPGLAVTLLGRIGCPGLTRLSLPCPREGHSDGDILQRFIQRSGCIITNAELTFDHYEKRLACPAAFLSALSGTTDLKLTFRAECPQGRLIECLSDRTVVPKLLTLTITATDISRSTWDGGLKDTLIRVLRTNLQEVVIVLGRETYMTPGGRDDGSVYYLEGYSSWREQGSRRLQDDFGEDWTVEDPVDADFVDFRKLKERGLDIHLSIWTLSFEWHIQMTFKPLNDRHRVLK
ncbi:hypothetical protein CPB85DRAFT_1452238 [Mucidula mucida]|nr:hypothetical protein CPB85DRAFT_1452238 [Mucidula mucida]